MDFIKNPVTMCRKIFAYIHQMTGFIRARVLEDDPGEGNPNYLTKEGLTIQLYFRYTLSY